MQYTRNIFLRVVLLFTVIILLGQSCKKDSYFFNSGTEKAAYPGNILDYLQAKPLYFDTLLKVIHLAGMDNILSNDSVTFFAPPDPMIMGSVRTLNSYLRNNGKDTVSELSEISAATWKKTLSLYIYSGVYRLKDFPQIDTSALISYPGQYYESYGGRPMNIGVIYNDADSVKYVGYRQLLLSYIPDFSQPNRGSLRVPVASSDIAPLNGIVHVLQFPNNYFGFDTTQFILSALDNGITTK